MNIYKRQLKTIFLTEEVDNTLVNEISPEKEENNLEIDQGLLYSMKEHDVLEKFIIFIKLSLELQEIPKIHLLSKRKEGMTYGAFDPSTNEIYVYAKNRGLADVIRTTAHELTHYKQKIENRIPKNLQLRDHTLESEANTKAGDIVYMFGLENPQIYELGDFKQDNIEIPKN